MDDKLIYIPNNDIQSYPFCRLKLNYKNLWKSPKLISQRIKKTRYYETLETSVINNPIFSPFLTSKEKSKKEKKKYWAAYFIFYVDIPEIQITTTILKLAYKTKHPTTTLKTAHTNKDTQGQIYAQKLPRIFKNTSIYRIEIQKSSNDHIF